MKKERGITLIALVITIVVLLILAGISIAMVTGDNGILTQAARAKEETEKAKANEQNILTGYEQIINSSTGVTLETITGYETKNTVTQDSLGNRVVVPAGFKVVNPEDNVEDGIVIEDVSHGATTGSQFVWIPVGKNIKKKNETTFNITLSRYTFNSLGEKTLQGENIIYEYYQEKNLELRNSTAIDINDFILKVNLIGGYYIARYEAKDGITTSARDSSTSDANQLVCTSNNYVYNYVTQQQAASLSQNMYKDSNFTSDLVNSYAWDTTLVFIQECSGDYDYPRQNSLNIGNLAPTGTKEDIRCNIFDMASNCREWSTETSIYPNISGVNRGGGYANSGHYADHRNFDSVGLSIDTHSFRPILYINKIQ